MPQCRRHALTRGRDIDGPTPKEGPSRAGRAAIAAAFAACMYIAATVASPVAADDDKGCKSDQDCALAAVERGEMRSFADVLAFVRQQVAGQVVGVKLEREDGLWVYEIKVLTENGRRRKLEVNARSLTILKQKDD